MSNVAWLWVALGSFFVAIGGYVVSLVMRERRLRGRLGGGSKDTH